MSGDEENQAAPEGQDELKVMKELVEKLLNSSIEAQQRSDKMVE